MNCKVVAAVMVLVLLVAVGTGCGGPEAPENGTPDTPGTLASANTEYQNIVQLARWHQDRGEHQEALPLFQEALQIAEETLGPSDPEVVTALENLASAHVHLEQHRQALPLLQRALSLRESAPDPDPLELVVPLENLASVHYHLEQYRQALPLFRRALGIRENAPDTEPLDLALALEHLASAHYHLEQYRQALPLFQRALDIRDSAPDTEPLDLIATLERLASAHYRLEQYREALPLFQRALDIRESAPNTNPLDQATALENLASTHYHLEQYQQALPAFQLALEIRESALGLYHAETAATLSNVVEVYLITEQYDEALPLARQAVEIQERLLGPDHPRLAVALSNLGSTYFRLGKYTEALVYYQRALAIREKSLGPDHPDTAVSLNNLALLRKQQGDYSQAQELYQKALEIMEKARGARHPDTATALDNLGDVYFTVGNYNQALTHFQRALEIREEVLGPDHLDTATSLNNLALLHKHQGEYAQALRFYTRSLEIMEEKLGPDHAGTATALDNLADLYASIDDYSQALPLFNRALEIRQQALGPEHPDTAASLSNLGALHFHMGNDQQALSHLQQALAIREKTLGPNHPDTATFISNLGVLHRSAGDDAQAFQLFQRALTIRRSTLGLDHPATATALSNLGTTYLDMGEYDQALPLLEQALEIRQKTLGTEHPSTAMSLNSLAVLHQSQGDYGQALNLFQRALAIEDNVFRNVFSTASEEQKLLFAQANQWSYHTTLSLVRQHLHDDPQAVRFGLELVLARKGIVQDAQAQTQAVLAANLEGETLAAWQRLDRHRSNLAHLLLSGPGGQDSAGYQQAIEELNAAITREEQFLAQRSARLAQEMALRKPTIEALVERLPGNGVLVEFVRVQERTQETGDSASASRYLAFVLALDGQVAMVDLGDAEEIDRKVTGTLELINDPNYASDLESYTRSTDAALEDLYRLLLQPLAETLGRHTRLIVSPDGELNKVPFAALRTPEGRYLIESHAVSYVASGRDLLRDSVEQSTGADLLLVADPAFEDPAALQTAPAAERGGRATDFQATFPRLPGTAEEAKVIPPLVRGEQKIVLDRGQATESAVKSAAAPRVLHLATHGFFLEDQALPVTDLETISSLISDTQERGLGGVAKLPLPTVGGVTAGSRLNPMARSGLAFAGANHAGAATSGDDGILTALEVTGMNLHGTRLVVLSACQTAVGEVSVGEGVFGLRRAFVLAGAENLLMSLWLVSDQITVDQMEEFYRAFGQGKSPPEALRQAQLKTMTDLRQLTEARLGEPLAPVKLWAPFMVQQTGE